MKLPVVVTRRLIQALSFLLSLSLHAQVSVREDNIQYSNDWIIQIQESQSIEEIAKKYDADNYRALKIGSLEGYYLLMYNNKSKDPSGFIQRLKSNTNIIKFERDRLIDVVKKNTNDPQITDQWHLNNTGQDQGIVGIDANVLPAWGAGYTGKDITICIVDDGVQHAHEDLSTNYRPTLSYDFNDSDTDPTGVDGDNHGTSCAGVAAATGNNAIGVAGVAYEADLSAVRLIASGFTASTAAMAVNYRQDSNYIFSNSWGPKDNGLYHQISSIILDAIQEGSTNGRNGLGSIYTWAAGNGRNANDNTNYDPYVNSIYTIGVGAHGNTGVYSWYSEPGASMMISAPSSGGALGITTTDRIGNEGYNNSNYTNNFGGTSSATPLVSGVVALMLEANPNLTWRDVQHILVNTAVKIDSTHSDWQINAANHNINHNYGFGAIDTYGAIQAALSWNNVQSQVSDTSEILVANTAISDLGEVVSEISVNEKIKVEHVELLINASHSYAGDLAITLTSPSGTMSILSESRRQENGSFSEHKFMSVRNWGESANGSWQIKIVDELAGDVGTLNWLQLIVNGTPLYNCDTESIDLVEDLNGGEYTTAASISSSSDILSGTTILQAEDFILLHSGFSISTGATFLAEIIDCPN